DESNNDAGFAAFAESAAGDQFRLGWYQTTATFQNYNQRMTTPPTFINANKWEGNSTNPEFFQNAEMTANKNAGSNGFWLMFGSSLNNTHTDESFGVGMIEIWVK
ncbi:MAG TPA: hypothetical protein VJ508_18515, partial [Saprospiraceae bacterium]|nr:hypothetical protein [Saprospiraceae bacterium]